VLQSVAECCRVCNDAGMVRCTSSVDTHVSRDAFVCVSSIILTCDMITYTDSNSSSRVPTSARVNFSRQTPNVAAEGIGSLPAAELSAGKCCCSVSQCVAVCCSVSQCVAELQSVAVCCSAVTEALERILRIASEQCKTLQHTAIQLQRALKCAAV